MQPVQVLQAAGSQNQTVAIVQIAVTKAYKKEKTCIIGKIRYNSLITTIQGGL